MKNPTLLRPLLGILSFLLLAAFFGLLYRNVGSPNRLSEQVKKVLDAAGSANTYESHVLTHAVLPNRTISITGDYKVDRPNTRYSAISTTTLYIQDIHSIDIFTLQNVAFGQDIFTKLETNSVRLAKTMPRTRGWKHFTRGAIPEEFANIAVATPVSDNLSLLSDHGKYLSFVRSEIKDGESETPETHYIFKLSNEKPIPATAADSLYQRIGTQGVIDIQIDSTRQQVTTLHFENPMYQSTTTISHINEQILFTKPVAHE